MVGYTDLSKEKLIEHYSAAELHKDACDVMAHQLTQAGPGKKVEWKCKDTWKGNMDNVDFKKFRKNQH